MKHLLNLSLAFLVALVMIGCSNQKADATDKHNSDGTAAEMASATDMMATVGHTAPNFTLTDSKGNTHSLSDFRGKHVVLEWINYDCPFVKKHYNSGNMQALQSKYTEAGVVWLSICSSAQGKQGYFEGDVLKNRIKIEESKATAYLIDVDGKVGKMYDAKTTPHMYIIDPEGNLKYMGAIDSKASTSAADIPGSDNYVMMAMDQLMAGGEVKMASTKSYGCSVKY